MADVLAPFQLGDVKADAETGLVAGLGILRRPHLLQCFGFQNRSARSLAAGKKHAQEPCQIRDRGVHAAGRRHAQRKRRGIEHAAVKCPHEAFRQIPGCFRSRLKAAFLETQRIEDRMLQIPRKRLPFQLLEHIADRRHAGIGILGVCLGLVDQFRLIEAVDRLCQ